MRRVTAISGWGSKGPACFLVELDGRRFILDLGEGPDVGQRPDITGIDPVDAILISHGHGDHVGALDLAERLGNPPVYATAPTRAFAHEAALREASDLPYGGTMNIAGIEIDTGLAGHAPGAVWIRLGGSEGVVYSGDYSSESPVFRHSALPRAAALIADASYGEANEPLDEQIARLVARARSRPLLLPAPPAGRALEMALHLHEAGIELALCPTVHDHARTLAHHQSAVASARYDWLADTRMRHETLHAGSPPHGVMIVAGAQAERGLSKELTERFATSGEADIVFTGHVARGLAAERLVNQGSASVLRWNVHPTLDGLRELVEQVQPRSLLPAFLPRERLAALATAFPDIAVAVAEPTIR